MMKLVAVLAACFVATVAFAQAVLPEVGAFKPTETVAVLVSAFLGWVTNPLTALLKRAFKTEGIQTELVHFVLSVILVAGIGFTTGAYGQGWPGVYTMLSAALMAFLTGRGIFKQSQDAAKSALGK